MPGTPTTTRKRNPVPVPPSRRGYRHRDTQLIESPAVWLADRRESDAAAWGCTDELWCVDGKLYDLSAYAHPGGDAWLALLRGTDVSDAFHTYHLDQRKARAALRKFYVRDAPRRGATAFDWSDERGFYATLLRRALAALPTRAARQPTAAFLYLCTFVLVLFLDCFFLMCYARSAAVAYGAALVCGLALHGLFGIGHNFFHQASVRGTPASRWQYVFDLTLFSSHHWKVTHGVSHHTYPNSELDVEVSGIEPFLYFLSNRKRNCFPLVHVLFHFIALFAAPLDYARHVAFSVVGREQWRVENFAPLLELAALVYFQGAARGAALFGVAQCACSWLVLTMSFPVHRTELAWTEGDAHGDERDFGRFILRSTHDHSYKLNALASVLLFAGLNNHTLHHLFPAVDHSRLYDLLPLLHATCDEFNVPRPKFHDFSSLFASMLRRHDLIPTTEAVTMAEDGEAHAEENEETKKRK